MDFSSVKLKKTETKNLSALGPVVAICENDAQYAKLMEETLLETYLESLGDITFPTFVLSNLDQSALKQAHLLKSWRGVDALERLALSIDKGMKDRGWNLVFVRLSSRSPKDAALLRPDFRAVLMRHYGELPQGARNSKLLALYAAATESMGCKNGAEALDLLTASERIQDDLSNMTGLNVCVRKFVSFLPEYELRAFVWDKKLTAITQYNQFVVSERLKRNSEQCLAACKDCFELIKTKIPLARFAIDFVVIQEGEVFKAYVVEINPCAEFTGFGLFDWQIDSKIIKGLAPFEFRIAQTEPKVLDIDKAYAAMLESF